MSTVSQVVTEVRRIIHDEGSPFRWSDQEIFAYINAGNRQTVALIPDANTIETIADTLTSRVARQSLPTGGIKFIRVSRNYADDTVTPQGVLRYVEKDSLDTFEPTWEYISAKADGANYFEHFCHDPSEPTVYYLYPAPAADNKQIALVYSAIPAIMTSAASTLPLGDQYFNAIVQYTVYRCLTKEARETIPSAFRQELWQNYLMTLGLQSEAETQVSAENNRAPEGS